MPEAQEVEVEPQVLVFGVGVRGREVGQDVEVKVLNVETDRKRISLSLKAMAPEPAEPTVDADETTPAEDAERESKRENLKGGMGGDAPGGIFGNPGDYK